MFCIQAVRQGHALLGGQPPAVIPYSYS
jgi:hypothetical protein